MIEIAIITIVFAHTKGSFFGIIITETRKQAKHKGGKDMKYIVMVDGFEEAEFNNKIDTIRFIMQMVKYAKADRDSITIWDSEGHEVLQGVVR